MVTFSTALVLAVLSLIAAGIATHGRPHPKNTLDDDSSDYVSSFYATEQFYRAFLVNLSFSGISLSMTTNGGPTGKLLDWWNGGIYVVLNLLFVLFIVYIIRERDDEMTRSEAKRVGWTVTCGVLLYLLTLVAAGYRQSHEPTGAKEDGGRTSSAAIRPLQGP